MTCHYEQVAQSDFAPQGGLRAFQESMRIRSSVQSAVETRSSDDARQALGTRSTYEDAAAAYEWTDNIALSVAGPDSLEWNTGWVCQVTRAVDGCHGHMRKAWRHVYRTPTL
jgi:hypothetical protein